MEGLPKIAVLPPIALEEGELLSICRKYTEIDFGSEKSSRIDVDDSGLAQGGLANNEHSPSPQQQNALNLNSSPASHHERDNESSQLTCSTTHTTPLKHLVVSNTSRLRNEYTTFLSELLVCDLPLEATTYFKSLASQIVQIGGHLQLHQHNENKQDAEDMLMEEAQELVHLLESSSKNCAEQIKNIEHVKSLAAFTLVPTDVALWSNYRQRVSLVSRNLALPSLSEYSLIEALIQVHDAYVHDTYLQLTNRGAPTAESMLSTTLRTMIDDLTTTVHNLLIVYERWLRASQLFRATHMLPLLRRIQDSPWVRREIEQLEINIEMARMSLQKKYESGEIERVLQEDQLRGAEMLAERRSKSSVLPGQLGRGDGLSTGSGKGNGKAKIGRAGTRVRREHTM